MPEPEHRGVEVLGPVGASLPLNPLIDLIGYRVVYLDSLGDLSLKWFEHALRRRLDCHELSLPLLLAFEETSDNDFELESGRNQLLGFVFQVS